MKHARPCLLLWILLVASLPVQSAGIDIPYDKFTLDNGLTVIVHEDRRVPVVSVSVTYRVGAKDEPAGKTGFAHLFEHLMFNGSENYDHDWFRALEEIGVSDVNGTTGADYTNYYQTVPTVALDAVLWLESDRMGHLLGAVTQDKLDEQRGVVQNEKRQREDRPYGRVWPNIVENLYPKGHPYAHSPIGSMEDLNAATLEDVRGWFETYYGPSNAIVVIAGDTTADEVRPKLEKYFGDIPSGPPLTKWSAWVPDRTETTRITMSDQVSAARIYRTWVTPRASEPDSARLDLAAEVLGGSDTSRLYRALVYEKQLADDVTAYLSDGLLASTFGVVVTAKPGTDVGVLESELDALLSEFLDEGPSRRELDLAVTSITASAYSDLETVSAKSYQLAAGELLARNPDFYIEQLERMAAASPGSVQTSARKWLRDNWHQVTVTPFPSYTVSENSIDRSTGLPTVEDVPAAFEFPEVEEARLENGIRLVVVNWPGVPVVRTALNFDAGVAASPSDRPGLARFVDALVDQGAGKRNAQEIATELQRLGASVSARSSIDVTAIQMKALKKNLQPSLSLFADLVRRPHFSTAEIERQRGKLLGKLESFKFDPVAIALTELPPLVFGKDHAYGSSWTGMGTEESIKAVTRDDIQGFYDQWLRPDRVTILVVGDTTMADIRELIDDEFGDWQADGHGGTKSVPMIPLADHARVLLIDRPGSTQSTILAGHVGPPPSVDNDVAIKAMTEIVGSGFLSRINMNLREDKGWSYGAAAQLVGGRHQRMLIAVAPVQTDQTGPAIAELKKELADIAGSRPATEEELERVKSSNIQSLTGQFESGYSVLDSLRRSDTLGRPWDYPQTLPAHYGALTLQDVKDAAVSLLRPHKLTWVIIGDAELILEQVEAAGIGPVEVRGMRDG